MGLSEPGPVVLSVKAVETLQDFTRDDWRWTLDQLRAAVDGEPIKEPDGSQVVVEATSYAVLASKVPGFDIHGFEGSTVEACAAILTAFNAAQSEGVR